MITVDTNILMDDASSLILLNDDMIVPMTVVYELEKAKKYMDEVGYNARTALKMIYEAVVNNDGVLPNGKSIKVDGDKIIPSNDQSIIDTAKSFGCALATNDVAMMLIANWQKVDVIHHDRKDREDVDHIGEVETVELDSKHLIDEMYSKGSILAEQIKMDNNLQNACYIIKHGQSSVLARRIGNRIVTVKCRKEMSGVKPRDNGQKFLADMLLDNGIKVLFVTGKSGSGKTLLTLAAALHLNDNNSGKGTRKIICAKPMTPIGDDVGFLPGEIGDKLGPHYASFDDQIKHLMTGKQVDGENFNMANKNKISVVYEHIGYMRGRTFPNSYIIIDEVQNLNVHEVKSIISRAGENSKVILLGDLKQIDTGLSMYDNGLTLAQKKLCDEELVGHIFLPKSVRSDISVLSEKI